MNPETLHLKETEPDGTLPEGYLTLPEALQSKAAELAAWAKANRHTPVPVATTASRALRKRERQNRRQGRRYN